MDWLVVLSFVIFLCAFVCVIIILFIFNVYVYDSMWILYFYLNWSLLPGKNLVKNNQVMFLVNEQHSDEYFIILFCTIYFVLQCNYK